MKRATLAENEPFLIFGAIQCNRSITEALRHRGKNLNLHLLINVHRLWFGLLHFGYYKMRCIRHRVTCVPMHRWVSSTNRISPLILHVSYKKTKVEPMMID